MGFLDIILISVGLATDAFAVSVADGMSRSVGRVRYAIASSLCYGIFQGVMPVIGYFSGRLLSNWISDIDHYVAFVLLGFLGGAMIYEQLKKGKGDESPDADTGILPVRQILIKGVTTSIDALAVGISLAALGVDIFSAAVVIAAVTLGLSLGGFWIGKKAGGLLKQQAKLFGGAILIGIGIKILVEHLVKGI